MENNNYSCQDYVKKILSEIGIVYTKQLIVAICKRFNVSVEYAFDILKNMQKNRRVLLSQDGYAMTVGTYAQYIDDRFFDRIVNSTEDFAIPFDIGKEIQIDKELINTFWYIAITGEEAKDFVICNYPWKICFNTECKDNEESHLYQIAYIPENKETTTYYLLRSMPEIESEAFKKVVNRIAIIDDESHLVLVPYLGFREIYVLKKNGGIELIGERSEEEAWKDYV